MQNRERWAAEDQDIDARLAALWAGIVVIIGGLAWMWLLLDRASFIGAEPDLFSGVSPGLVVALAGTLVALVGTDIVTIGAWVSRRRT